MSKPEVVYTSGFRPDPANALDVLAFVLCDAEVFAGTSDPLVLAEMRVLLEAGKHEAVRVWHGHQSGRPILN